MLEREPNPLAGEPKIEGGSVDFAAVVIFMAYENWLVVWNMNCMLMDG